MTDKVIHIDTQKIDAEIQAFEQQIASAQSSISVWHGEIDFRKRLKEYVSSHNGNAGQTNHEHSTESVVGPTDFIFTYLTKYGRARARQIIDAYAESLGVIYEEVKSNVFNSLSRLKKAGKLDTESATEGKGDVWFIKK